MPTDAMNRRKSRLSNSPDAGRNLKSNAIVLKPAMKVAAYIITRTLKDDIMLSRPSMHPDGHDGSAPSQRQVTEMICFIVNEDANATMLGVARVRGEQLWDLLQ